jgi:hypothetical protein
VPADDDPVIEEMVLVLVEDVVVEVVVLFETLVVDEVDKVVVVEVEVVLLVVVVEVELEVLTEVVEVVVDVDDVEAVELVVVTGGEVADWIASPIVTKS